MASKSSKRGSRTRTAKRRQKKATARRPKRRAASAHRRAAKAKPSASAAKAPRETLPAWNEIEIDEERESAGRPETAFLSNGAYANDDLAEELGEEFVMTATSGEQAAEDLRNQDVPEELGGPFVETSARTEFAYGSDPSNPKDAEPSAFPMAINSLEEEAEADEEQEERTS